MRWTRPQIALPLFALWLLATIGLRPLLLPDEGRYGNVSREMLHGDGLTPLLNGLPFFHKPPLMYWIDMAAMSLFGPQVWTARLAPAVGGFVMGSAMFLWASRRHGADGAWTALIVLATSPFFYVASQYANLDMLVGGMICATVFAFARSVDGSGVDVRWMLAGWALGALSVLAKGLIGIVLPALIIGPWLLVFGRWRQLLRLLDLRGIALFAVIALPWFVLMQHRYPGFFDYFIVEQHFRRYAQASFNNVLPIWFYFAALPLLTLPWSLWLPVAMRQAWRDRAGADRDVMALYVWWLVAVVGFFSLPSSKLVGYVLPALAPWCLLLARAMHSRDRLWRLTAPVAAVLVQIPVLLLASPSVLERMRLRPPPSSEGAARAMASQMAKGDRVVLVDEAFYDLPFLANLAEPPIVASRWDDPEIPRRDNWRKEFFDAGRFDPARARELLRPIDQLGGLACHDHAVWFVAKPGDASLAAVPGLTPVYTGRSVQLMRGDGRSSCAK